MVIISKAPPPSTGFFTRNYQSQYKVLKYCVLCTRLSTYFRKCQCTRYFVLLYLSTSKKYFLAKIRKNFVDFEKIRNFLENFGKFYEFFRKSTKVLSKKYWTFRTFWWNAVYSVLYYCTLLKKSEVLGT